MTDQSITPPPELVQQWDIEPSSLCIGSINNLCAGWLCVFEGTEDECRQYFQDGNVPIEYDRVFIMNRYRETILRPCVEHTDDQSFVCYAIEALPE